jgi:hypothetical protein
MVSAIARGERQMDLSLLFLHRQVLAGRSSVEGPPKLPFAGLRLALSRVFGDSSGAVHRDSFKVNGKRLKGLHSAFGYFCKSPPVHYGLTPEK